MKSKCSGLSFSKKAIKKMKDLNDKTKTAGKEHSSVLVKKGKKIDLMGLYIGGDHHADLPEDHHKVEGFIGGFHTHSSSTEFNPSETDLKTKEDTRVECIGTPNSKKRKDKLACLVGNEYTGLEKIYPNECSK